MDHLQHLRRKAVLLLDYEKGHQWEQEQSPDWRKSEQKRGEGGTARRAREFENLEGKNARAQKTEKENAGRVKS